MVDEAIVRVRAISKETFLIVHLGMQIKWEKITGGFLFSHGERKLRISLEFIPQIKSTSNLVSTKTKCQY